MLKFLVHSFMGFVLLSNLVLTIASADTGSDSPARENLIYLDEVTVRAQPVSPTRQQGDLLYTGSGLTKIGRELSGIGGLSSVYQAFSVLPGINAELKDTTGIGGSEIRIRGVRSLFAGLSVEGIPNYGIMSIGPRDYLYDIENMDDMRLYRGATPADLSSGTGNRGGTIALSYQRPAEDFGFNFEQSIGSHALSRSFLRLDSGRLQSETAFFISGSHTEAEKWKGAGDVGGREHLTLGINQKLGERMDAEFFYNLDDAEQDLYKGLSYAQADQISSHYNDDYLESLTGSSADVNYYKYHHSETENHDLMTVFRYRFSDDQSLTVKPYYAQEDKKWIDGAADKVVDSERFGVKFEYVGQWHDSVVSTGYWYEDHDLEKYVRRNRIDASGRNYAGWAYLAENKGRGEAHTPYFQIGRHFGPFTVQAGIKYFSYKEPASRAYLSNTTTSSSYAEALENNLGIDQAMSLDSMNYSEWLPNLSLGYQVSSAFDIYLNYGRNFMRPYAYVPIAVTYAQNRASFQAAGVSLQDIFDTWDLETSDNIDLGFRYRQGWFSLAPTLFYARHHDLLFVAYDDNIGVNYHQNIGDATIWGTELECNFYPSENLMLFINPSYTQATFDNDLVNAGGILHAKDQDLPDTPRFLVNAGMIYQWGNLTFAPTVKYVDSRYGDIENQEKVDAYTTVDVTTGYRLKNFKYFKETGVELEFINLFDKKYVGGISASDDGSSTAQYYAGIPFTVVVKFNGHF